MISYTGGVTPLMCGEYSKRVELLPLSNTEVLTSLLRRSNCRGRVDREFLLGKCRVSSLPTAFRPATNCSVNTQPFRQASSATSGRNSRAAHTAGVESVGASVEMIITVSCQLTAHVVSLPMAFLASYLKLGPLLLEDGHA